MDRPLDRATWKFTSTLYNACKRARSGFIEVEPDRSICLEGEREGGGRKRSDPIRFDSNSSSRYFFFRKREDRTIGLQTDKLLRLIGL